MPRKLDFPQQQKQRAQQKAKQKKQQQQQQDIAERGDSDKGDGRGQKKGERERVNWAKRLKCFGIAFCQPASAFA